ncbi:winged helix-turn-helix transcriptional regulator [Clostridium sediminicola]|uniref:winged helix-turn-helix transcriptional regulator n=1 Tax=Clostridium sediminicola TaxID=3114879 RepID=UPI0031F1F8BE
MDDKEIKILELLNANNNLSQRDISSSTGLSLGTVNSKLKNLIEKEYLSYDKTNNKTLYTLTKLGFKLIEEKLKISKNRKLELHQKSFKTVSQAVILAAGKVSDFDKPIGFLEFEDISLIERTIDQLFLHNIDNVVIITGYQNKYFDKFVKDKRIKLVYNDRFKWTGTMHSLSLASLHIDDDFLLIENDILFEERTLKHLLQNENRDCILITNESGSGDEAFVEIRNGFLYKMSKDIHQFNKIDGEMIGISKISFAVYNLMLEEFQNNRNPYLNYEYLLMDIGRNYNIGFTKIDDLVWAEIDNLEQYINVKNHIFPKMKRKELKIRVDNIKTIVSESLNLDKAKIKNIQPIGGMTNKNFKISINDESFVLRLPGYGTDEMISRKNEFKNSAYAHTYGFDTEVMYFNETSGIKISRFVENAETLNGSTAKKEDNMKLVANILKQLHTSEIVFENKFDVFHLINIYESLLKKYNGKNFEDYEIIKEKVFKLKDYIFDLNVPEVPCHNDTVPENFIKNGDDKIFLIDWEYSGMNDPMWDLAAHSLECDFSQDEEELFLKIYFDGEYDTSTNIRLLINKILQDFLWALWTNIKEAKGDDFGTYGYDRYVRVKENLKILFKKYI